MGFFVKAKSAIVDPQDAAVTAPIFTGIIHCYCSISWINNHQFSSHNNLSTWTMHSLMLAHSNTTLPHTDGCHLHASLCYSTTSLFTNKSVHHLEVHMSCYYIELLPLTETISCNHSWLWTHSTWFMSRTLNPWSAVRSANKKPHSESWLARSPLVTCLMI